MNPEKLIEWNEILGNPYRQPLHPDMLTAEGYTVRKLGRMQGMGKSEQPIQLKITYRFDYVAAFLATTVFCKLGTSTREQVLSAFSSAYENWKSNGHDYPSGDAPAVG